MTASTSNGSYRSLGMSTSHVPSGVAMAMTTGSVFGSSTRTAYLVPSRASMARTFWRRDSAASDRGGRGSGGAIAARMSGLWALRAVQQVSG